MSPICSVNTNCRAAFQENNATQQAELAHSSKHQHVPAEGRQCKKSSMRFDTNSNLWLMVDISAVTVTLSPLCIKSQDICLSLYHSTNSSNKTGPGERERKQSGYKALPSEEESGVGVGVGVRGCVRSAQRPVLTRSVFVVVAEVKVNCPAKLQHIAPLVFVNNFIF